MHPFVPFVRLGTFFLAWAAGVGCGSLAARQCEQHAHHVVVNEDVHFVEAGLEHGGVAGGFCGEAEGEALRKGRLASRHYSRIGMTHRRIGPPAHRVKGDLTESEKP